LINGKRILAIIPARGGSKRLPRKNVLPLAGKPLIGWTIEAAQQSKYIDDIFVSTDCDEIASVAEKFVVSVPELRPKELGTDTSTTQDVILYTLEKFGSDSDVIIILQPTSPLRNAKHIDNALALFENKNAFSVVSVTPCEHSPLWANTLPIDNSMGEFIRPQGLKRSQDLEQYYRLNGAIYIYNIKQLKQLQKLAYTDESYAFKMENQHSIDIDNKFDFEIANFILSNRLKIH
jgi:CMP-N,N'-diacetyllegionaminic acid synthase